MEAEHTPSVATKSELLILVNQRKKNKALKDLYFFTKYVLGYNLLHPVPHGELCEWIQLTLWDETILLVPRGTYKSTIGTVSFSLWMLARDPELRILIASAEHSHTKGWLSEIKTHCEHNDEFISLFGNWVPRRAVEREKRWTATAIRISPTTRRTSTPSVVATSSAITKVSQHYDMAICDDLMNDKTSANREQVNKQENYLQLLLPILDPQLGHHKPDQHGPRKIIGTRWGHDDLYIRLMTRDDQRIRASRRKKKSKRVQRHWKTFVRKALERKPDGTVNLFFPVVFTEKYLNRLLVESGMSWYNFSAQYLNDPQSDEETMFKLDTMGFWNRWGRTLTPAEVELGLTDVVLPVPKLNRALTICDPAGSDLLENDQTAIVTVSIAEDRMRFIRNVVLGNWRNPSKIVDAISHEYFKFHPAWIGVEEMSFGIYIRPMVTKLLRDHGVSLPIRPMKPAHRAKEERIRGLEPFIDDGCTFWRLPDEIKISDYATRRPGGHRVEYDRIRLYNLLSEGMAELMDQLLRFPTNTRRDAADALAYLVPDFDVSPNARRIQGPREGSFFWHMGRIQERKRRGVRGT